VISRLFSLIQPDVIIFRQKDCQQHVLIRRLIEDFCLQIGIVCGPTVREKDWLARASSSTVKMSVPRHRRPTRFSLTSVRICRQANGISLSSSNRPRPTPKRVASFPITPAFGVAKVWH
jgi:pantoate--beta-alanine ligase